MNYIFFGTPKFAAIILEKLIAADMPPALVVCNPDKPVGRKKFLTAPAFKTRIMNQESRIKVLQPEKLTGSEFENLKSEIINLKCEVGIVAAYAKIIPKEVIDLFPKGIIGVHPSLLPKYRGATPIQSVILNGEKETGVTLYVLDDKVDHGPIITESKYEVAETDTYLALEEKLARMGGELLASVIEPYARGEIEPKEQNHAEATLTKKFTTEDGYVDLGKDDPETIARKIRALNPEPGVWTIQNGKRLKLLEVKKIDGTWTITKTQLEGKNPKEVRMVVG